MSAKHALLEETQANTQKTNQLYQLLTYNRQLEKQLNARQKSMVKHFGCFGHSENHLINMYVCMCVCPY